MPLKVALQHCCRLPVFFLGGSKVSAYRRASRVSTLTACRGRQASTSLAYVTLKDYNDPVHRRLHTTQTKPTPETMRTMNPNTKHEARPSHALTKLVAKTAARYTSMKTLPNPSLTATLLQEHTGLPTPARSSRKSFGHSHPTDHQLHRIRTILLAAGIGHETNTIPLSANSAH